MQTIALSDTVVIELSETDAGGALPEITVSGSHGDVPSGADNTAYRAAAAYFARLRSRGDAAAAGHGWSVRIRIDKRIPMQAGLGGGSADAAGTLAGLDHLFRGALSRGELLEAAAETGADVPFCLTGGTAVCRGIGDRIEPAPPFGARPLVIVKPDFGIPTPWAFRQLDEGGGGMRPDFGAVTAALAAGDMAGLFRRTANVFEGIAFQAYPILADIKKSLRGTAGCRGALMSGSGTALFAVYGSPDEAGAAAARMREIYGRHKFFITVTETAAAGPEIVLRRRKIPEGSGDGRFGGS